MGKVDNKKVTTISTQTAKTVAQASKSGKTQKTETKAAKTETKATKNETKDESVKLSAKEQKRAGTTKEKTDDNGNKVIKTYDENGKLASKTTEYPSGTTIEKTYERDANGNVTNKTKEKKNADGDTVKKTTIKNDKNGNVAKTTTEKIDPSTGKTTKKVTEKANGKTTAVSYNEDGNPTKKTVTNEKTGETKKTTYQYDDKGNNIQKETTNSKTGKTKTTNYEYDNKKNITKSHTDETNKDGVVVKQTDTTYEKGLKKSKVVKQPLRNDKGEVYDNIQLSKTDYTYTKDGKLKSAQKTKANGDVKTTEYDTTTGKKLKSETKDSRGFTTKEVKYDAKGKKTSSTKYSLDENGAVKGMKTYTYNKHGEVTTRTTKNAIGVPEMYSEYTHNEDGSMTRVDYNSDGTVKGSKEFYYDAEGNVTKVEKKNKNGKVKATTEFTYSEAGVKASSIKKDANGNPLKEVTYMPNGSKAQEKTYEYWDDNSLASIKTTVFKASVGDIDGKGSNGISQIIEKDADGNKISEINYELNEFGQPISAEGEDAGGKYTVKYQYDENHRLISEKTTGEDGLESAKSYKYVGNTEIVAKETHTDDAGNKTVVLERELKTEMQGVSTLVQTFTETKLNDDGTKSTQEVQIKNGKLVGVSTDKDNDGNFEQINQYNKKEKLSGIFTDKNDDGSIDKYQKIKNGQVTESYSYKVTKNGNIKVSVDENGDGKIDYKTKSIENDKGQTSKMKFDFDKDGKFDQIQKFEYDEKGNMTGRYTDFENDGKYDLFETIKNGKVVSEKDLTKPDKKVVDKGDKGDKGKDITGTDGDGKGKDKSKVTDLDDITGDDVAGTSDDGNIYAIKPDASGKGSVKAANGKTVTLEQGKYYVDGKEVRYNQDTGQYIPKAKIGTLVSWQDSTSLPSSERSHSGGGGKIEGNSSNYAQVRNVQKDFSEGADINVKSSHSGGGHRFR